MYCYQCDTRNPDQARFCVNCGRTLPVPANTAAQPIAMPAPATFAPQAYAPALAGAGAATPTIVQHIYLNQPQQWQPPQTWLVQQPANLLVRALWFLLVGLWVGPLWTLIAWFFMVTLIGLPVGLWMLNRLPQVMTLRPQPLQIHVHPATGGVSVTRSNAPNLVARSLYFVLVGWWFSLLWLMLAWGVAATIIGLPLAFLMFEYTGAVTTLAD